MKALDVLRGYIEGWRNGVVYWNTNATIPKADGKFHPNQTTCQRNAEQCEETAQTLERIEQTIQTLTGEWFVGYACRENRPENYERVSKLLLERVKALMKLDAEEGHTAPPATAAPQEEGDPR